MLDQDGRREKPLAILRLAGVTYVNSSGMGLFIKYSDRYRTAGGEICFTEVSTKVLALFRMMGLLSVLRVFSSEAQAVEALQNTAAKAPPSVGTPADVQSAPSAVSSSLASAPPPAGMSFPYAFACHGCKTLLLFPEPGFYKCPTCGACFLAEPRKELRIFLAERRNPFEAAIAYDARYLDGICAILERIAEGAGLSAGEKEDLSRACRGFLEGLIQRANGSNQLLRVLAASDPGECLIGVRSDVRLRGGEGDPLLDGMRRAADSVQLIDAGAGGSLFKIKKRSAVPPRQAQTPS